MPKPRTSRSATRNVPRARLTNIRNGGTRSTATRPLAAVQLDAMQCDAVVAHPTTGAPIGRPWITIAIDTGSRMVTGLHLSLDQPSATSVDRCIRHSISRKDAYLARLGISGTWPVQGPMAAIAIDLHPSPRSAALTATLTKHHIKLLRRSTSTRTRTAIGETVIRELGQGLSPWTGITRSHPAQAAAHESVAMTLPELERILVDFIVNVYHLRSHAVLGMPPIHAWTAATARLSAGPTAS